MRDSAYRLAEFNFDGAISKLRCAAFRLVPSSVLILAH